MNKVLKIIKFFVKLILELALAGVAFGLLFNLAWIFGRQILERDWLVGNDSDFALSLAYWFGRWWPRIPLWFPLQGTGVSLFHSYPMLSTFLIIWLTKITHLSTAEIFRILSFAAFPLTAFGVYVLARRKIGNSVAAIFAGVFFLLNQASWIFQRLHGIFAQSFSMIFVPWCFLFFDLFLVRRKSKNKNDFIARLAAILAVIFLALTFLCHVVTGTVVTASLFGYAIFYFQFSLALRSRIKDRLKVLFMSFFPPAFCFVLAASLAGFWLIPFSFYNRLANREGLLNMDMTQLKEVSLLPKTLAGFNDFRTGDLRYDYFFFALPVILLSLIGLLGSSLIRKRGVFSWGLVAFGAALYTSLPLYLPKLVDLCKYLFTAVYFRALIATIILLPVIAAFGAFFLADLPFWIIGKLRAGVRRNSLDPGSGTSFDPGSSVKKSSEPGSSMGWLKRMGKFTYNSLRFVFVSLAVFFICLFFILRFEHRPPDNTTKMRPEYGISAYKAYGPTLGEDLEILKNDWSVLFKRPDIKVNPKGTDIAPSLLGFIRDFQLNQTSRVDVSAYSGEAFLQRAPLVTDATFVNLYHYFASLIHKMWGYQQGVFYGHDSIYDNPELLKELSYWFGIEYTVIVPGFDREANYQKVGWQLVKPGGLPDNPLPVYRFPEAEGLLTVTDRPVALVIGSFENEAYDQVFRSSNAGAFSYQDLWLIEGSRRLDDYSLKELKKFDLLILHGYGYKNKAKAWSLIEQFVEDGGNVFIDTGWQYVSSDWGSRDSGEANLPEPAPVRQTSWGKVSSDWSSFTIDPSLGKLETDSFKPFLWENNPWGAALAQEAQLRSGSEVLMKDENGVVLASRNFGKGKIIWSGINLISHSQGPEGEKEIGVLKAIFDQLIPDKSPAQAGQLASWQRDFPDQVEIKLTSDLAGKWLLWREAYSPNWQAISAGKKLPVHRAGPGFVLVKLPDLLSQTNLTLLYQLNFFEGFLAKVISVCTVIILFLYLIFGTKIEMLVSKNLKKFFNKYKKLPSLSLGGNREDENY